MKKLSGKQKKYLTNMFALIVICEILLKIDNKLFQSLGILLVPFIVTLGVLLLKEDSQNDTN